MGFGGRSAFQYAPGDAGSNNKRQPSRDAVPSSWTQSAQEAAQSTALVLTGAIALAVIFLLGRRK